MPRGRNSGKPYEEIYAENWLPVPDWPDYLVSDLGRVRHFDGLQWWMVNSHKFQRHKHIVILSRKDRKMSFALDALVMRLFVGERPEGYRIIHKNHILSDSAVENMEYVPKERYDQWFREHFKAIGRTKNADEKAKKRQHREERRTAHVEAASRYLRDESTLRAAAESIGLKTSALSVWIKRNNFTLEEEN